MLHTTTPTLQVCRSCGGGAPVDVHFCPQCTKILSLGRHGDYFSFLGLAAQAESRRRRSRAAVSRAQPAVPSRLLLQRDAGRAAGEPRAVVVSERRVSHAAQSGGARRVPAASSKASAPKRSGGRVEAGAAGAPRGSVRAQRGARRDSRAASGRRARGGVEGAARARAAADRGASAPSTSAQLQELSRPLGRLLDADAPDAERRAVLEALRERLLERNYINNLLAGIERELSA